jgi:hypothetical protein
LVSHAVQEVITGTGHATRQDDDLGVVCRRQPDEGCGQVTGDSPGDLLSRRVTAGGGSEQCGGGGAIHTFRPGPGYGRTRRHRLQTAPLTTSAQGAQFIDDDMSNLTSHAPSSSQQHTLQYDAGRYSGSDAH